jgi:hypothetical protein
MFSLAGTQDRFDCQRATAPRSVGPDGEIDRSTPAQSHAHEAADHLVESGVSADDVDGAGRLRFRKGPFVATRPSNNRTPSLRHRFAEGLPASRKTPCNASYRRWRFMAWLSTSRRWSDVRAMQASG